MIKNMNAIESIEKIHFLSRFFTKASLFILIILSSACNNKIPPELIDIELSGGEITPTFSKDITDYTLTLKERQTKTNISAVSTGYGAKIFFSINDNDFKFIKSGDISLDYDLSTDFNKIDLIVTNDDLVKTYRISTYKNTKAPVKLSSLKSTPGLMEPTFSGNVTDYKVGLPNRAGYIYYNPSSDDALVSISVNNSDFSEIEQNKYSKPIPVKVGINNIIMRVEKEGFNSTDYNFKVIRYENADLKSISVTPGFFEEQLTPEVSLYNVKLSNNITKITFELKPEDDKASITMYNKKTPQKITIPTNSKYDFNPVTPNEEFIAVVKASDGYRRYYTFKITR